jgi:uncharacterized membrane protein
MRLSRRLALAAYIALLLLVLGWELLAAPATPLPRAFWAGVKTVPLLVPVYWLVRGGARAHVLAALLVLLYFCDGIATAYLAARAGTAHALGYAAAEIAAALSFIGAATFYARFRLRAPSARDPGRTAP